MYKVIFDLAVSGAAELLDRVRGRLASAGSSPSAPLGFPDTAYALPTTLALSGIRVTDLGSAREALRSAAAWMPAESPAAVESLADLSAAVDAGKAALIAEELLEALGRTSAEDDASQSRVTWAGFPGDALFRSLGVRLVDGRLPAVCVIVGAPETAEQAVSVARALQKRNVLSLLAGRTADRSMAEQLADAGVETTWETLLVPLGPDVSAVAYALGIVARAAMTFGGLNPEGPEAADHILDYCRARVNAFVLALGSDDLASETGRRDACAKVATAAGALAFGIPTIAQAKLPEILEHGLCTYEALVSDVPIDRIVEEAIEVRGIKLKVTEIPIPVPYGAGFEGERVRKEQMHAEFGGKRSMAFELLRGRSMDAVADGRITLIGPDIDRIAPGDALPLGTLVEVAGRGFREEFESVLERRIHEFSGWTSGVMHIGQRATVWLRISRQAYSEGFRLRHLGEVLVAKLREEFGVLIDKIQVTLITDEARFGDVIEEARGVYRARDERIRGMQDEDTDTYYSCTLCQSFAPDHVCIVTPERPGLCGAYSWLDCAASHEIHPHGPNQPVRKGEVLDVVRGQWQGVNEFLSVASNGSLTRFSAYSIMEDPMTSCGCFECIAAIVPEANGVMIVNREFTGMTPVGMTFSTMAGEIGGGIQTPGFLGIGRLYICSRKFISAEGGIARVVWMPSELKGALYHDLSQRARDAGFEDLVDRIATEFEATTPDELLAYLERVGHPALTMDSLF